MVYAVLTHRVSPIGGVQLQIPHRCGCRKNPSELILTVSALARPIMAAAAARRKKPKNLRFPRRAKVPPEPNTPTFTKKRIPRENASETNSDDMRGREEEDDPTWSPDEIEAISSLFRGRIPQKPGKAAKPRPLPLPLPYKVRPTGYPTPKRHIRAASRLRLSSRSSFSSRVYKDPQKLVGIAREISRLPSETDVAQVLDRWLAFLRKGSLSMTIRELGHMGLPERALQTFCWAQKQSQFYPDDRILASTVEILARTRGLKKPIDLEKFVNSASRTVMEAMARGLIRAGSFHLARKLLLIAKDNNRTLGAGIHAKLILELGKDPDRHRLVSALLDELGEREDLDLKQQDCTAIMKVCIRLGKFEAVESLFSWYKELGNDPSLVMYTTVVHCRYCEKKYREALMLVWEMEELNFTLDLPAYRVVIRLCVALGDLSRAARYFSKMKGAGFSPPYDIYRDMLKIYVCSGLWTKVEEVRKEVEMGGFKLDKETLSLLSDIKGSKTSL